MQDIGMSKTFTSTLAYLCNIEISYPMDTLVLQQSRSKAVPTLSDKAIFFFRTRLIIFMILKDREVQPPSTHRG